MVYDLSPRIVCQSFQLYRVSFERVRIRRNSNNCASQVSKEMQDASRVREAKEQTPKARELAPSTRRIARQPSDGFAISGMHRQPTFASQQPTSDSDTSFDPGPLPATPTWQNRGMSVWRHTCRQMLLRISAELRVHPAENVPFPNVSTSHVRIVIFFFESNTKRIVILIEYFSNSIQYFRIEANMF